MTHATIKRRLRRPLLGARALLGISLSLAFSSSVLAAGKQQVHAASGVEFSINQAESSAGSVDLKFSFEGRTLHAVLKDNSARLGELGRRIGGSGTQIYAGELRELPGSWVRLSQTNGQWSGAFFDGKELFLVDHLEQIASSLPKHLESQLRQSKSRNVAFRASDVEVEGSCASTAADIYQETIADSQALSPAVLEAASRQVSVKVFADPSYVTDTGGDAAATLASQLNVMDGIFDAQVGLKLNFQTTIMSSNQGLTSTDASTLLSQFRSFMNSQGNPGLGHLMTGKNNLAGGTAGIAYLSAVCGSYGVGVSEAGGRGTTGALIAAHEIGHNLGAPHDNQSGSACSSTAGTFLMNPSVNGSSTFSQCSLNQINSTIANKSCITTVSGGDTTPPSVPGNLRTTAVRAKNVTLAWGAANDNQGVTRYEIYRDGTLAGSTNGSTYSYKNTGLTPDTSYNYTVRACDAAENCSQHSNTVNVRTNKQNNTQTPSTGSFGITADGTLYHSKGGYSAAWNYLCLNSDCQPGSLKNGRFELNKANAISIGERYSIEFKVEDNGTQCLSGVQTVTQTATGVSAASACTDK